MKTKHYIRNTLLTGFCLGLMTGCSWLDSWPPKNSEMARKTAPKPPEAAAPAETANNKWINGSEKKVEEVTAADATVEPMGLNVNPEADRIARLEETVSQMSNDMKLMMPALTKLAEAQGDMQKSMNNVEPAAGGTAAHAMPSQIAPQQITQQTAQQNSGPQPGTVAWYEEQERKKRQGTQTYNNAPQGNTYQQAMAQPQQAYQPAQQQNYQPPQNTYQKPAYRPPPQNNYQPASYSGGYNGTAVTNVRFGEHPGKTRMVLDTTAKAAFSYNVDNNEGIVMISLPGTGWQGMAQMIVRNSPLVASYNVTPDNQGGQQLIIQLKQPAQILWSQALAPSGGLGNRVVFDFAPL